MTSATPPTSGAGDPLGYDPADGLALLNQSQETVVVLQQLDFGPWWYVPVLSLAYPAIFGWISGESGVLGVVFAVVAVVGGCLVAIHDRRRRGVRLSWESRVSRSGRAMGIMFATNFVLIAASLQTSYLFDGRDGLSLIGISVIWWVGSIVVLSIARAALHRERAKVVG